MVDEMPEMKLRAIGVVRNGLDTPPTPRSDWEKVTSEIVIDGSLNEALDGIEEFSHLVVLFWMHRLREGDTPLKQRPMGNLDRPLKGLFALRTPNRPNPVGKTTVRLLERKGNILKVKGLDALDGSPVIDIKPYMPGYDAAADATVPAWIAN
ncbi:MAG: tRNA (N6-threonylcarbamoyladenosine(37)-N6)-methyltransferase TrmO [Dehalococcoidales bacterium]|nr:MAG: tRNA (N6-threonylcarbamoyladenosine(37)-N6)-methyltransferase TrmO [Dehalococcoidales bacterium]